MRRMMYLFVLITILLSCGNTVEDKAVELNKSIVKNENVSMDTSLNEKSKKISYHPSNFNKEVFDTIINSDDNKYYISITKKIDTSFVTQYHEDENTIYEYNYYDFIYLLEVNKNETLMFKNSYDKSYFIKYVDAEFLKSSVLHNFDFSSFDLKNEKLETFVNVNVPETSDGFVCNMFFGLDGFLGLEELEY